MQPKKAITEETINFFACGFFKLQFMGGLTWRLGTKFGYVLALNVEYLTLSRMLRTKLPFLSSTLSCQSFSLSDWQGWGSYFWKKNLVTVTVTFRQGTSQLQLPLYIVQIWLKNDNVSLTKSLVHIGHQQSCYILTINKCFYYDKVLHVSYSWVSCITVKGASKFSSMCLLTYSEVKKLN